MPILFNLLLEKAGLPLADVRLLRHKDNRAAKGRSPYDLWRNNRAKFELYQSNQSIENRKKLNAPYWAVFIVNHSEETMFGGLYGVKYQGLLKHDTPKPHMDGIDKAGSGDVYELTLQDLLNDLIGKLFINWGPGALAWVQYASKNDKPITELHAEFKEPEFPGFLNFIEPLSKIDELPTSWLTALKSSKGVYLLRQCKIISHQSPRT